MPLVQGAHAKIQGTLHRQHNPWPCRVHNNHFKCSSGPTRLVHTPSPGPAVHVISHRPVRNLGPRTQKAKHAPHGLCSEHEQLDNQGSMPRLAKDIRTCIGWTASILIFL